MGPFQGLLSSVVEHSPCKRKVVSSILTGGSTKSSVQGSYLAIPTAIKIAFFPSFVVNSIPCRHAGRRKIELDRFGSPRLHRLPGTGRRRPAIGTAHLAAGRHRRIRESQDRRTLTPAYSILSYSLRPAIAARSFDSTCIARRGAQGRALSSHVSAREHPSNQLPKLNTRVRFPSSAPVTDRRPARPRGSGGRPAACR